jgi:Protein of unknown function (DUF1553)/Protein of unknown function (DUF1549)/Planctomycete cytochrome C
MKSLQGCKGPVDATVCNLMVACLFLHLVGVKPVKADVYTDKIKPVLQQRCYACHAALKQEAGLRLDTVASMLTGGDSGPIIDSAMAESSSLLERITHPDPSQRMPPEGEPLSADQIDWIKTWINSGAVPPENDLPQPDPRDHWAFQNPQRAVFPADSADQHSAADLSDNPIDRFLVGKHRQLGIQPLERADKQTLIRRLFIDLLGIPPQPSEVHQFIEDQSSDAYQKLVDRLLARPEYGERWGRHWMDVWRYSDWYGRRAVPDVMNSYPQIWRWRDWIVRSLNQDKGYDRMLMEMLAADELCPSDDDNVVATGFLVRNWYKWNYETWMKDNVEHTGKAFLGLTLNCAHCHDHKYDPISHEDYFRFRAFFEPLELRHDRVAGQADPGPFKKYVYADSYGPISTGAIRVFDEKLDAQTFMYSGGDARNRIEGKPPVAPGPPQSLCRTQLVIDPVTLPIEASYPGLKEFVRRDEIQKATSDFERAKAACDTASSALEQAVSKLTELRLQVAGPATAANQPTLETLVAVDHAVILARADIRISVAARNLRQAQLDWLRSRIAADDARFRASGNIELLANLASRAERQVAFTAAEHAALVLEKTLLAAELKLATVAADDTQLNATKQAAAKAEQDLQAARKTSDAARTALNSSDTNYTPLSPSYPTQSTGRRLALARWIANRDNPLTARVAINHMWLRHFGQALVETTDNLGVQGKLPEHQEILDWLAVELMEHDGSMKHIHRIMLTSQAYQRRSIAPASYPAVAIDAENRTYWRNNPRRMEAEVVRDSVLACSGTLDRTLGGPEIDPVSWATNPRRSLYFTIHGESKMQFLDTFDGPNVCDCYRRTSTVLPQQALAMTNSELLVHNGRVLAKRVIEEILEADATAETIDNRFVTAVFERIINRPPSAAEWELSLGFLRQQQLLLGSTPADQLRLEGVKQIMPTATDIAQRTREMLTISLFSHNDFVTAY